MNQGENFKKELKKQRITQEDAAAKLGISLSTIGRMFKEPELETFEIEKIKEVLKITIPPVPAKPDDKANGIDFKEAYYKLLEKHNQLLEELLGKKLDDKDKGKK